MARPLRQGPGRHDRSLVLALTTVLVINLEYMLLGLPLLGAPWFRAV